MTVEERVLDLIAELQQLGRTVTVVPSDEIRVEVGTLIVENKRLPGDASIAMPARATRIAIDGVEIAMRTVKATVMLEVGDVARAEILLAVLP